jgi:hypothetical protein
MFTETQRNLSQSLRRKVVINSADSGLTTGQERDFEISVGLRRGSTRLANVRDGVEDYDMISLLRSLDPAAAAEAAEAVALFSDGFCARPCV